MNASNNACYRCGETQNNSLEELYGYTVCTGCKRKLGLFLDPTIERHVADYQKAHEEDPEHRTYLQEVVYLLDYMEKDYIGKRIKLLHIKDRLQYLAPKE